MGEEGLEGKTESVKICKGRRRREEWEREQWRGERGRKGEGGGRRELAHSEVSTFRGLTVEINKL